MIFHGLGNVAQISDNSDLDALGAQAQAHRIDGIVRNRETVHFDISDCKARARLKHLDDGRCLAPIDGGRRQPADINRDWPLAVQNAPSHQGGKAGDMVAMLVRDDNAVQVLRPRTGAVQASLELAKAQPGVDQNTRFFGSHESGVSRASARQHAEPDDSTLRKDSEYNTRLVGVVWTR